MIFNDLGFLFVFLPLVLIAVYVTFPAEARVWVLLAGSLIFYCFSGVIHAGLLLLCILWVYWITAPPAVMQGNWVRLVLAILLPVASLLYFKYANFLLSPIRLLIGAEESRHFSLLRDVVLPAGISFFTFQLVSFAIDRFRGTIPEQPRFKHFALYVSFFPHLVAGPILRYEDIREQLLRLERFVPASSDLVVACGYIVFGLFSKVLIADIVAGEIAPFVATPVLLTPSGAIYVVLGYSFQIYFDFYGYSLIAIGLARLFGIGFPANFLRPYESLSPREFWRRWHVTLSSWIRDYLYLPLGGNQRYVRNIVIVFAACGLWHGAGWNFVVWGLLHGGMVIGYQLLRRHWDRWPRLIQWALTFTLVSLGWTLFLYDFQGAADIIRALFGAGGSLGPDIIDWWSLAIAGVVCFTVNFERLIARIEKASRYPAALWGALLASLAVGAVMFLDKTSSFIYFRF